MDKEIIQLLSKFHFQNYQILKEPHFSKEIYHPKKLK